MPSHRLFSPTPLAPDTTVELGEEPSRYVGRVLRLRIGDTLTLFDGTGGEYGASVDAIGKRQLTLAVGKHDDRERESPLALHLVQGLCKGEKMDLVVQKATELGVSRISPVQTEYSVVRLDDKRAAKRRTHWQKVARSACEQCGRNRVPDIDPPVSLLTWLGEHAGRLPAGIVLHPTADAPFAAADPGGGPLTVAIGPEGGFSEAEIERALAAGLTARSLGPRILRTETAAVVALGVAQTRWGDLGAS